MAGYKSTEEVFMRFSGFCSYPSCKKRKINKNDPIVIWDSVDFPKEEVENRLSPLGKLAVIANPSDWIEKFEHYGFNIELHPECAAEWGMHLIQNALAANPEIGRTLTKRGKNAIRK